ncbi:MAG: response regulator [Thioalkalivibrio sp.]|nr:response regulator [Thioalkalivibrio sp.]
MTPNPPEKTRVLFVEDEMDQAHLVLTFFSKLPDFSVTHVQDGDQALRMLDEREWELLVTDLNVPGADGFEVMRAAKQSNRHLPILAVTSYTQEHFWDQAFRAGADQVLVKPLDRDEFLARVRSMLGTRTDAKERASKARSTILVVEGLMGDGVMGCGGACAAAVEAGSQVVILPIPVDPPRVDPGEFSAGKAAARTLGLTLRLAESLVGDADAMAMMLRRAIEELRPAAVYAPARGDRHPSRAAASRMAAQASDGRALVYGYQTASSPSTFTPKRTLDIAPYLPIKAEALEHFAESGTTRKDLDPELAHAYARYWGRLKDFGEVEAFEIIQEKDS